MNQHSFDFIADETDTRRTRRAGAFIDNMSLPVHRWFRYSAGFSASWASKTISESDIRAGEFVFDPFAGSGTTLVAAQSVGVASAGTEFHEFVARVAKAKLCWVADHAAFTSAAREILRNAEKDVSSVSVPHSELLARCYAPEALLRLEALKQAFERTELAPDIGNLVWLAITAILRECSGVGTAQWQYLLPNKAKQRVSDPFAAFQRRVQMFAGDMREMQRGIRGASAEILYSDARAVNEIKHLTGKVKLVLTSPPYPNNFDYADATRLEMTFWREVNSWGDLHSAVRHRLIRSCSQHSAADQLKLETLLEDEAVRPIARELRDVCMQLEAIRHTKGGKKSYHTMVAAYFVDLAKTWSALVPLCAEGARACFVIGDSAPYGIYVPADRWLSTLAVAAGFRAPRFEQIRERNLKWKNRKHRVPLKEGRLWVER